MGIDVGSTVDHYLWNKLLRIGSLLWRGHVGDFIITLFVVVLRGPKLVFVVVIDIHLITVIVFIVTGRRDSAGLAGRCSASGHNATAWLRGLDAVVLKIFEGIIITATGQQEVQSVYQETDWSLLSFDLLRRGPSSSSSSLLSSSSPLLSPCRLRGGSLATE
jgi:hypothetical protein